MGNVVLPNPLTDGTSAKGSEVRANDDAIVAQVNGNIEDVNIKVGAAINGSKLSNVAGNRVPTDRVEDDAIDTNKLRDDAAVDANRAVTTNHLRDASVTKPKVAAQAITLDKMVVTVQAVAFSLGTFAGTPDRGLIAVARRTNGLNYDAIVNVLTNNGAGSPNPTQLAASVIVTPTTPIPTATSELLSVYVADQAFALNTVSGKVVFVSISRA